MSANPYDSPDNYDSPFHRVKESDTDRQIQEIKTRFAEKLAEQIPTVSGVKLINILHSPFSTFITIAFRHNSHNVKINYEMNKKLFQEPYTTFASVNYAINDGRIAGFYESNFEGQELRWRVIRIMEICYNISKMPGFGTSRGGDWTNETPSFRLADDEFKRLLEESHKSIQQKETKEREEKQRNEDFMKRLLSR